MAPAPATLTSLVTALRARSLDRTLTTALPASDPGDPAAVAPTGLATLDLRLGGGFPRGQLSELTGPRSSGRASVLLAMIAAATSRGELAALVDVLDMFDVESAVAAGVHLQRLLWVRGHVVMNPGACRELNQRAMEQAIRALTLVLQAGNFGLVAFDAGEAPAEALRSLPFTTWLRLQRMVEGRPTVCALVGPEPMARSSAGLTVKLDVTNAAPGIQKPALPPPDSKPTSVRDAMAAPAARLSQSWRGPLFNGLEIEARIVRARAQHRDPGAVAFASRAVHV
jgi:hypothetical protein